jgi:hypothetical protein
MKQDVVLLLLLPLRPSLPFSKVTSISTLHLLSLKVFTGLHSIDLLVFMVDTLSLVLFSLQFLFIVELVTTTPLLHTSVLNALLGTGTSLTLFESSFSLQFTLGEKVFNFLSLFEVTLSRLCKLFEINGSNAFWYSSPPA